MAIDLDPSEVETQERPVVLNGLRWSTYRAIIQDVGDDHPLRTRYDRGCLELGTSVLHGIRWGTYQAILDDLGEHRGVRLAFNRGRLEFMSPNIPHESFKSLIGRMVEMFTLELRIPIRAGGSATLDRPDLDKGVEPDECYWIAREIEVRDRMELDFTTDPAPDLAIEIDETHSSLPNLEIYAALNVPEVWRLVKRAILIHHLQPDGSYAIRSDSPSLLGLTAADVDRFLHRGEEIDDTSLIGEFRDWVRAEILPRRQGEAPGVGR
jgi:Uma2 family endonuclease